MGRSLAHLPLILREGLDFESPETQQQAGRNHFHPERRVLSWRRRSEVGWVTSLEARWVDGHPPHLAVI